MEKQLTSLNFNSAEKGRERAAWIYKGTAEFILNPTPPFGFLIPPLWVNAALNKLSCLVG